MVGRSVRKRCVRIMIAVGAIIGPWQGAVAQRVAVDVRSSSAVKESTVTIDVDDATLVSVVRDVAKQAGLTPAYSAAVGGGGPRGWGVVI
jgi:hypothetical protein